jgi:hypothetical protein
MAEGTKYLIIRKLLKALGLSDEAVEDIVQWIEDLLLGKGKKELNDFPYKTRDDFLSPAEMSFYLTLRGCVSEWGDVCPKVNLGDLFYAVSKNFGEKQSYTNRINRKHVDFLICDKITTKPLLGIELDDKSHNLASRQERDTFVENVFKVANLTLVRIPVRSAYNPKELNTYLLQMAGVKNPLPVREPEVIISADIVVPSGISASNNPTCPKCSSEMALRTAKTGTNQGQQFWGCTNFPKCRTVLAYTSVERVDSL